MLNNFEALKKQDVSTMAKLISKADGICKQCIVFNAGGRCRRIQDACYQCAVDWLMEESTVLK